MTTENTQVQDLETTTEQEKTTTYVDVENLTETEAQDAVKEVVEKAKRGPKSKKDTETTQEVKVETTKVTTVSDASTTKLGVFKLNKHTKIPSFGTQASACFDIRVNLEGELESGNDTVSVFTKNNQSIARRIERDGDKLFVELRPYERLIAPTGAIYDIPEGYSLKVHPRSGTSLKQGINLINQEAVIDSDFVEELKLLLVNSSEGYVKIYHDERYAQGELQEVIPTVFEELKERPQQKTDRVGGLGHTGTK